MNPRHPARIAARAFTLLETLVIMAIIGVLTALLLPVLAQTRDRAKEAVCLDHFHQIGIGFKMYQGDNQGRYPLGGTLITSPGALIPRGTDRDRMWSFNTALGGADGASGTPMLPPANARPLSRYVPTPETFRCPADGGINFTARDGPKWSSSWQRYGCSYRYNAGGWGEGPSYRTRVSNKSEEWVQEASRFVLVYEPPAKAETWNNEPFYVRWHRAHPATTDYGKPAGPLISPILFADDHAAILDFTKEVYRHPNDRQVIWYHPE